MHSMQGQKSALPGAWLFLLSAARCEKRSTSGRYPPGTGPYDSSAEPSFTSPRTHGRRPHWLCHHKLGCHANVDRGRRKVIAGDIRHDFVEGAWLHPGATEFPLAGGAFCRRACFRAVERSDLLASERRTRYRFATAPAARAQDPPRRRSLATIFPLSDDHLY